MMYLKSVIAPAGKIIDLLILAKISLPKIC
jgi:hypothetical protein